MLFSGSRCTTVTVVGQEQWVAATMNVLGPFLKERDLGSSISYGSDCSGLDAPYWGLQHILKAIEAAVSTQLIHQKHVPYDRMTV